MSNLGVNKAIMEQGLEGIQVDDLWQEHFDRHENVFVALYWCTKVKILEVDGHEFGAGGGQNTVKQDFGSCDISHFSAHVTRVLYTIATNSPADMTGLWLLGAICADHMEVSGFAILEE